MPIKTVNSTGGNFIDLIPNPDGTGYMGYGSLSPDGSKIAYLYYPADGTSQLRVAALDGSGSDVVIAQTSLSAINPNAWANVAWGNAYIAVNCNGTDNNSPVGYGGLTGLNVGIRFFDENGNSPPAGIIDVVDDSWTNVYPSELDLANTYDYPTGSNYDNMSWSPQGRYLYTNTTRRMDTSNNPAYCIVRIDTHDTVGHDLEIIAQPPDPGPVNGQIDYMWPVLSPDGTTLVVTKRTRPWAGGSWSYSLITMNEDGSNITPLVNDVAWPIWSPDGTKLCGYNTGSSFGYYEPVIYDINANTVSLVNTDSTSIGNVAWTPVLNPRPPENPRNVPHPTPLTGKVWFFDSNTDNLIHTVDPDGTNNTLRDSQVAPNHVWLGAGSPSNAWAIRPQGDYAYFYDTSHSSNFRLYKSWNDSTHYRKIAEIPGTYRFNNFQTSWDGTRILADIVGPSGTAYLWMNSPNGISPTLTVTPSNLATNWQFLYSQGAMQCLAPDGQTALIWNSVTNHVGTFDCGTGAYQDFGALGWIAPAWSSQNKIAYLSAPNVVIIDGTTHAVEHTFSLSPAGSLNYICMWNPAGTELLLDDNAGTIKRYQPDGTYINTLTGIYPSWPIGWS